MPLNERPAEPASGDTPSPAWERFVTCRWHKPAETGQPAHCTQRDVLSMAGVHGFSPDAWCADCTYFKVRRIPRKPPLP